MIMAPSRDCLLPAPAVAIWREAFPPSAFGPQRRCVLEACADEGPEGHTLWDSGSSRESSPRSPRLAIFDAPVACGRSPRPPCFQVSL